jgi:type II secretory pathway component PulM
MGEGVIDLLLRRSARERLLLLGLAVIGVPLVLFLYVFEPLVVARSEASARLDSAERLHALVAERNADYAALSPGARSRADGTVVAPIGIAGLEASLDAAGLRQSLSDLARGGDEVIELSFQEVEFVRLGQWLGAVVPDWGYRIDAFRIEAGPRPGHVDADYTLVPAE